jgi:hypothetical protein
MPVTAQTAQEIFIGAGDVYVDDNLVGATMDNNLFRVVQEKGTPDLNGVPGPLEGLDYISSETAELEVTVPELSADKLGYAVPGAVSTAQDAIGVPTGGGASTDLASPSIVGATQIVVSSATGIVISDVLQIGAAGAREFRTVTSIAGAPTIDLDAPLASAHAATDPVVEVDATTLAADAAAGATNVKLTSVTGLALGDYLRIGYPGEQEVRRLTFVGTAGAGGTGVSFTVPLSRSHRSGDTALEQTNEGSTLIESGSGTARRIPSSAYHKWELRVPGLDGREVRFTLKSAIMTENPEFEATDDPETPLAPRLTLQARWDPAASTTSPWSIEKIGPTA